jgi:hypothetical protein
MVGWSGRGVDGVGAVDEWVAIGGSGTGVGNLEWAVRCGGGVDVVGLEGVSRVVKIWLALAVLGVEAVVLAWLVGVAVWDWWGAVLVGR